MAKKKSKLNLGKILSFAAALLAIVALALMFAPAIGIKDSDKAYTGWQVAFGYSEKAEILGSTVSTKVLLFSAYFIPYALLVGGLAFSVLAGLGILPKLSKFIAAGCYIAAGVLFFLAVQMVVPYTGGIEGDAKDLFLEKFREALTLSVGAIMSGIISILAGLTALVPVFIKK